MSATKAQRLVDSGYAIRIDHKRIAMLGSTNKVWRKSMSGDTPTMQLKPRGGRR